MSELTTRETRRVILYTTGDGKVTVELVEAAVVSILETTAASDKTNAEYEKFRVRQDLDYRSDFDLTLVRYLKGEEQP